MLYLVTWRTSQALLPFPCHSYLFSILFEWRFRTLTSCICCCVTFNKAKQLAHGNTRMIWFSLNVVFICCTLLLWFNPLFHLSMKVAMRAIRRHSIMLPKISTSNGWRIQFKLLCVNVLSTKNTKLNICILRAFSSPCLFQLQMWSDISMDFIEGLPLS